MSYRLGLLHGALLVGLLLAIFVVSHADDWLVVNGLAHHLDGNQHCNNTFTPGLGMEHGSESLRYVGGFYQNSNCRLSKYAAMAWLPIQYSNLRFGLLAGVVTGYRNSVLPAAALVAAYERQRYGVNLVLVPPTGDSSTGVLWLQGKVKW